MELRKKSKYSKSDKEAGLANTGVSNEDKLEEVIATEIIPDRKTY